MSQQFKISGGVPLKGKIRISSAKNALLPLLASTLITKDPIVIPVTNLIDTKSKLQLLEHIGYQIDISEDEITIYPSESINNALCNDLVSSIRSSILFLGPLLALTGKVSLQLPGGDDLARSCDFHINCLKQMGAVIHLENSIIHAHLPHKQQLQGTEYTFVKPSVGATQHMMLTGVLCAKGTVTVLNNCSQEPECIFLFNILRDKFKANIKKKGTQFTIVGNGHRLNTNTTHNIILIEDRIEALTYLSLGLITNGEVTIECKNLLSCIGGKDLNLLVKAGGELHIFDNCVTIKLRSKKLQAVKYFESGEFPEISTDFAPIFCALMGAAEGTTIFTETVHKDRFKYINEINKFNGSFKLNNNKENTIVIDGSNYIPSNEGVCTDIRGGMAIVMAALSTPGTSYIHNVYHIFRGYEYFVEKIVSLGGKVELI